MASWQVSSRVATVALVGLLVLDVTLVATALRSTSTSDIDTSPLSSAAASTEPTSTRATSAATTTPGSPRTPSVVAAGAPLLTMLVALDNQHAWRVSTGSCSAGGAKLATTVDGGRTWSKGSAKLRRIVRVRLESSQKAFVIGADASCAATIKNTSDAGSTWTPGGSVALAWYRDPGNPLVVRAPGSARFQPCGERAVLDLAVLAAGSARVLCADGRVRSTTDNGSTWTSIGNVDGAVALAVPTLRQSETYVARLGAPACAGVQILRVRQQVVAACVRASLPRVQGQVAMSLIAGGGWLAIGSTTLRSTDDLATWRQS